MAKRPATVTIDVEGCKGCILCVDVCPPRVLEMSADVNHKGYRYPLLHDGCTGCELCAKVCPDFVIEVYRGSPSPARFAAGLSPEGTGDTCSLSPEGTGDTPRLSPDGTGDIRPLSPPGRGTG